MFTGGFEDDRAGMRFAHEGVGEAAGVGEFGGAERGGLPLGAAGMDRDKRRFSAHRERDAAARERGLHGLAAGVDFFPTQSGERGGVHRGKRV